MGILSGKDNFSSKFTTAIIIDSSNRGRICPIKHVLGDFFLEEIEYQLYCFQLVPSREITFRGRGMRSYKVLIYSTDHIMPISPGNNRELEDLLRKNSLPKVDNMLLSTLKHLGKREKHDQKEFVAHDLKELFDKVADKQDEYSEYVRNLTTFFKNLNVEQITTPVKRISEFLEGDLITSNPQFWGMVVKGLESLEGMHKKVTNTPKTTKTNWIIIIALVSMVGLIIGLVLYLNSTGAFAHIIPTIGPVGIGGPTAAPQAGVSDFAKQYPTPESMISAIGNHTLSCTSLPKEMIKMVNTVKGGTCP